MEEKNKKRNYRLDYENNPRLGWVFKIMKAKGVGIEEITKKNQQGQSITGHSPMYYYHCLRKDNMTLREIDDLLALLGIRTEYRLVNRDRSLDVPGANLGGTVKIPRFNHVYDEQSDEYVKCRASFIDEALAKRNMTKSDLAEDIGRTRQSLYHMWTKDKMNMLTLAAICEAENWELVVLLSDETGNKEELHMNLSTSEEEKFILKKRSVISRKKRIDKLNDDTKDAKNPSEM